MMAWPWPSDEHYLNQWRLDYRRIYASLDFNKLKCRRWYRHCPLGFITYIDWIQLWSIFQMKSLSVFHSLLKFYLSSFELFLDCVKRCGLFSKVSLVQIVTRHLSIIWANEMCDSLYHWCSSPAVIRRLYCKLGDHGFQWWSYNQFTKSFH